MMCGDVCNCWVIFFCKIRLNGARCVWHRVDVKNWCMMMVETGRQNVADGHKRVIGDKQGWKRNDFERFCQCKKSFWNLQKMWKQPQKFALRGLNLCRGNTYDSSETSRTANPRLGKPNQKNFDRKIKFRNDFGLHFLHNTTTWHYISSLIVTLCTQSQRTCLMKSSVVHWSHSLFRSATLQLKFMIPKILTEVKFVPRQ